MRLNGASDTLLDSMISFSNSERFAQLDAVDCERLEVLTKLDQFAPGEEVLAAGRPSEWLSIICAGAIELCLPGPDGREVLLARLGPGDIYGELETFADLPPGMRHVARGATLVRACPKGPLKQELRARRTLATGLLFAYCRSISEKIRAADDQLAALRALHPTAPPSGSSTARASHLTDEERAWLSLLGQPQALPAETTVVREGDQTRSFYVLEAGEVEVCKAAPDGRQLALARLGPGDLFGMLSFLDGRPRSASVTSTAAGVHCIVIDASALDKALTVSFTVAFRFLGTLCRILGRTFSETAGQIAALANG